MTKKDNKSATETNTEATKLDAPKQHQADVPADAKRAPWPYVTIGIVAVVVILAFVALSWLDSFTISKTTTPETNRFDRNDAPRFDDRRMFDKNNESGSSRTAAHGVVSAVDGTTITVIGSGKQTIVKQTENTRISGGGKSELAVNDTISVYGTKNSDGSITATRIMIRNMIESGEAPTRERPRVREAVPSA